MSKARLEAFSDGVIAIIITIMVLEMKVPHGSEWATLKPLIPVFVSYVLSFINVGMYWANHHHMLHVAQHCNGRILWANLHLLFWLSLFPFVTGWMGENHFDTVPVALYGIVSLMAATAYLILAHILASFEEKDSKLNIALGKDYKGKLSLLIYAAAIPLSFVNRWIAFFMYVFVAAMWFIPDRRIEKTIS